VRTETLVCEECRRESEGSAEGWRSYLTAADEEEPETAAIYCPACAAREFGDREEA
jgi:Zn finger protein HypA/HybF involved in hydrogenase expression